jgi:hypothetical protein
MYQTVLCRKVILIPVTQLSGKELYGYMQKFTCCSMYFGAAVSGFKLISRAIAGEL